MIKQRARLAAALAMSLALITNAYGSATCPDEQSTAQVPTPQQIKEVCEPLEADMRRPSAFALDQYEQILNRYLGAMCHRNEDGGWKVDKRVRDTGPWVGTFANGRWTGQGYG